MALVQAFPAPLCAVDAQRLEIALKSVERSAPPFLTGDVAILSYRPVFGRVRHVGARFMHESFAVLHSFSLNEYGVFVLACEIPEGIDALRYRMVVDGLWMDDPVNPEYEMDAMGNRISVFRIEKPPQRQIRNPAPAADGGLIFTFRGKAGQRVSIIGDFNNWESSLNLLSEVPGRPGYFSIRLRVMSGEHYYCFFTEGARVLDPFNPQTATGPAGTPVSYFSVP